MKSKAQIEKSIKRLKHTVSEIEAYHDTPEAKVDPYVKNGSSRILLFGTKKLLMENQASLDSLS